MLIFDGTVNFLFTKSLPLPGAKNALRKISETPIKIRNRKIIALFFLQFFKILHCFRDMVVLCERYSHCIYSSCSIELTKTGNTWSLTAVWRVRKSESNMCVSESFRLFNAYNFNCTAAIIATVKYTIFASQ